MRLKQVPLNSRLTPRQMQLLKAIAEFQQNRCYSPTIAELADRLNIRRSTAFEHIAELRKKHLLSASPGKARSLNLTSKALELLDYFECENSGGFGSSAGGIALYGRVAAGAPIEAIEQSERLSLSSQFGDSDETFALEVVGNSMVEEDIRDGDYVICRKSQVAENGQLVVAIVDDENATLKRFYREKTCVRLQPSNRDFEPIYSDNCRIEAVVVGLVRKL